MTTALERAAGRFLSGTDEEAFAKRGTVRRFDARQALLHEGQVPDRVLLLLSGHVKVYSTTATGKEVVLAIRGPGELVGELSALDEEPRSASIVALERVEAVAVSSREFRAFLAERPEVALALLSVLSRRLRDADSKRIEYVAFQTTGRVAARIVELAERFGEAEGDAIGLELPLTQEDLAGWTGSSLESVGRALGTMRNLGWIKTQRRHILVLDLEGIRSAAE